jgi:DNA-binding NarL/FixJ family response regulator
MLFKINHDMQRSLGMSKPINLTQTFSSEATSAAEFAPEPLSEREQEVLQWLAAGVSNREISQRLYITENTVKRHVYNIFGKLNVRNRTQAAMRARRMGLAPQLNFFQL